MISCSFQRAEFWEQGASSCDGSGIYPLSRVERLEMVLDIYGEQASARFLQEAMSTIVLLIEGCNVIFFIWDVVELRSI